MPPDAALDAVFELLERHNSVLTTLLPDDDPRRLQLHNELLAAKLVRRFVTQSPPDKAKTDWVKLATLLVPVATLIVVTVAQLLGVDWKGVLP